MSYLKKVTFPFLKIYFVFLTNSDSELFSGQHRIPLTYAKWIGANIRDPAMKPFLLGEGVFSEYASCCGD